MVKYIGTLPLLLNFDYTELLGKVVVTVNDDGSIVGEFTLDTEKGKLVLEWMKEKDLLAVSTVTRPAKPLISKKE